LRKLEIISVSALLLFFAGICFKSQKWVSVTIDEFAHLPAGYYYWLTGDFQIYHKNPPLVKMIFSLPLLFEKPNAERYLNRLPKSAWYTWLYATDFMLKNWDHYIKIFESARVMVILMGMVLGLLVYLYSRSLYGKAGAFLSLLVYIFCPNMIAHSQMATVDTGASLFIFIAVVSLVFYLKNPSWKRAMLAGVGLGLAQLSKFSSIALLPFYAIAPLFLLYPFRTEQFSLKRLSLRAVQVGIMILIWIFMVCACYRFQEVFKKPRNIDLRSHWMKRIQKYTANLPAPFPQTYLLGMDRQMEDVEQGEFANYLLGKWYNGVDHRYFLIALLVKVPLPVQILFLLSLFLSLSVKKSRLKFLPEELLILAIIIWIVFLFSFRNSLQIGVRYLLPIFPLAHVLIGRIGKALEGASFLKKVIIAGLFIWLAGESLWIYPHYLSYFNELAGGPKNGHKVLLDSNLDWGQDLPALSDFMKKNKIDKIELWYFGHASPELYGINYQLLGQPPRLKYAAISAQFYYYTATEFYYPLLYYQPERTLREHKDPVTLSKNLRLPYLSKKPIATCGYSILVFEND